MDAAILSYDRNSLTIQKEMPSSTASISLSSTLLVAGSTVSINAFYSETLVALFTIRWGLLFMALLVLTDFWTGVVASVRIHHEEFRLSRAGRRTLAKYAEYITFIILAVVLGKSIGEPLELFTFQQSAAAMCLVALLLEADSIYGHICDLHHIKNPPSLKRLVVRYIIRRFTPDKSPIAETLEDLCSTTSTTSTPSPTTTASAKSNDTSSSPVQASTPSKGS